MKGWRDMEHQELAMAYFQTGRNCCQAITCAYCNEMGISESEANDLAENYGGGNYQGLCGALVGNYLVANALKGTLEIADPAKYREADTGKLHAAMTQEFEQSYGSLYCKELFGKRPCSDYVRAALEILEGNLVD